MTNCRGALGAVASQVLAAFANEAPSFEEKEKLLAAAKPKEKERSRGRGERRRSRSRSRERRRDSRHWPRHLECGDLKR